MPKAKKNFFLKWRESNNTVVNLPAPVVIVFVSVDLPAPSSLYATT